jgi:hypothetical protein
MPGGHDIFIGSPSQLVFGNDFNVLESNPERKENQNTISRAYMVSICFQY